MTFAVLLAVALLVPSIALAAGDAVPPGFPAPSFFAGVPVEKVAAVAGVIVTFICQCLRSGAFGAQVQRLPRRWRILVPLGLAAVVGVVGPWLGVADWEDGFKLALETAAMSVLTAEVVLANALGLRTGEAAKAPAAAPAAPPAEPMPPAPPQA